MPEPEIHVSRAERRREAREWKARGATTHQRVTWDLPIALVQKVREAAKELGIPEQHCAEMMVGAGHEVFLATKQAQTEKDSLVQIATTMPPRKQSLGGLLGGRG
jgi:hypothetical protein